MLEEKRQARLRVRSGHPTAANDLAPGRQSVQRERRARDDGRCEMIGRNSTRARSTGFDDARSHRLAVEVDSAGASMAPGHAGVVVETFGVPLSANRFAAALAWLGGGEWRELDESHERSTHVIAGVGLAGRGSGRRRVDAPVRAGGCAVDARTRSARGHGEPRRRRRARAGAARRG